MEPKDSPLVAWRAPAADDPPVAAGDVAGAFPVRLAGLAILVVDDNAANADALSILLVLEGAKVQVTGGGREALERLARERFDVVISDVAMPAMSGHEMLAAMRRSGLNARTPAIAYSGYGDLDDARPQGGPGFDRHLVKPATLERFVETILDLVRPGA